MAEGKTGKVFAIPCNRCRDLAEKIDALKTDDPELLDLAMHLHGQRKGFFLICVASEDYELWPGGEDIRDYQLGGRKNSVTVLRLD